MFVLLTLVACTDYDLQKKEEPAGPLPAIEVTPNPLRFAELPAGDSATQAFTIRSVGDAPLNVTAVTINAGEEAFSLVSDGVLGAWAPGESVDVLVTFTSDGDPVDGQATVMSNDAASPATLVDLLGGATMPDLVIDPDSVNFGAADVGATVEEQVDLYNAGSAPLQVTSITTTDTVFGFGLASSLPLEIPAGAREAVTLTFTPTTTGTWSGELQVASDDPDGVEVARLFGSSGGQPVAVCDVDPETIVADGRETADWLGSASYDPGGYAITGYDWRLITRPSGSTAFMPGGGANRRGFTTTTAGTYEAQLIVENAIGERSEPCFVTLEATEPPPPEEPPAADLPIYINTGDELWGFDPVALSATFIGSFEDAWGALGDSMTDIAIDLSGNMYGVTFSNLYRVNPATAEVTMIGATDESLVGLTFLSDGRLVGAGSSVVVVDTSSGRFTSTIVAAGRYSTSGDIVGLPDGNLYWATTSGSGNDDLTVVNPTTGTTTRRGSIGTSSVFGMAWYDDTLWGFTSGSYALAIDSATGRSTPSRVRGVWYGATTNPVVW